MTRGNRKPTKKVRIDLNSLGKVDIEMVYWDQVMLMGIVGFDLEAQNNGVVEGKLYLRRIHRATQ